MDEPSSRPRTLRSRSRINWLFAAQCGFPRPPRRLSAMMLPVYGRCFPDQLVIKSLDTVLLRDGTDCLFTYTTLNPDSEFTDADCPGRALSRAACSRIQSRSSDYRCRGRCVRCPHSVPRSRHPPATGGSCRRRTLEFQPFELGPDLSRCCLLLARRLGLPFAAIDLVDTPEGTFFIEVNPTGEWGWLSSPEQPIDSAIAAWLARPHSERA